MIHRCIDLSKVPPKRGRFAIYRGPRGGLYFYTTSGIKIAVPRDARGYVLSNPNRFRIFSLKNE